MTIDEDAYKESLRIQIRALNLTSEELIALCAQASVAPVTVGEFLDETVWPAMTEAKRTVYAPYVSAIKHGLPKLCSCKCTSCLDHFRGDSQWKPCPCVTAGDCTCTFVASKKGGVLANSCLTECAVLGDRPLRSVTAADWTQLQQWVQTRADKRTAVRNRKRAAEGLSLYQHDGRSAAEHLHAVIALIYKHAGGVIAGISDGMTKRLSKQKRPAVQPRSYKAGQIEELWTAVFLSGGDGLVG